MIAAATSNGKKYTANSYKDLYSQICADLSVYGPRTIAVMHGEKGMMIVSLYDGQDYATDRSGRKMPQFCS